MHVHVYVLEDSTLAGIITGTRISTYGLNTLSHYNDDI